MATFVESATLKLNKQEAQRTIQTINDINKRLRMLDRTAQSLKRTFAGFELFNTAALRKGSRELGRIQAQMQALRSQAQRPITQRVNVVQNRTAPAGAMLPPRRREMVGGGLALDVRSIIVYGAAITIARGAIAGFNERDIADARVAAQAFSPAQQALFDAQALELARDTPGLNIAQARQLMAENLGSAQQDVIASRRITEATQPLIDQQVALGKTWEQAIAEQSKIVRSLEQTGRITDQQGNIDVAKLAGAVALERAIATVLGVEYSGSARQQTAKLSRISGLTMNDPAVATLALMAEEQGTTAAVGYNQAIQNLTVRMTKRSEAQLESLGLREGGETKGERLLRTNLPAWIDQYLEPALQKNGIDTDDPAAVASAVAKVAGDRTSQAAIAALLLRDDELERQTAEIMRRQDAILRGEDLGISESSRAAFSRLSKEFTGFLGTVVNQFEGPLINAMDSTSRAFEIMSDATERLSDPMKRLLGIVGGAGLAGGGFFALKNIAGLATAGPNLNLAAANLNRAAFALSAGGVGGKAGAAAFGAAAGTSIATVVRGALVTAFARGGPIGALLYGLLNPTEANRGEQENIRRIEREILGETWEEYVQRRDLTGPPESRTSARPPSKIPALIRRDAPELLMPSQLPGKSINEQLEVINGQFRMFDDLAARANQDLDMTLTEGADNLGRSAEDLAAKGVEFGQNATDILEPAGTAFGQAAASEIMDYLAANIGRLRFASPPRTGLHTGADIGYHGSGEGPGTAATTAIGSWS